MEPVYPAKSHDGHVITHHHVDQQRDVRQAGVEVLETVVDEARLPLDGQVPVEIVSARTAEAHPGVEFELRTARRPEELLEFHLVRQGGPDLPVEVNTLAATGTGRP